LNGIARPLEHVKNLLASAGLEAIAGRPVRQLSQGVRQRLAIARGLLHGPQLVLLDEPFASLDAQGSRWLERLFDRWRRAGQTVCFATHDARRSRGLSDRVISLDAGRIAEIESTFRLTVPSLQSA
jgi:ABC-type nitrate/sulfonate/bicarbonate transport system ATPase subunit